MGRLDAAGASRRITPLYVSALLALAALFVFGQWMTQRSLADLEDAARRVNHSGRQRMLSQRIARSALLAGRGGDLRDRALRLLEADLLEIERGHRWLERDWGETGRTEPGIETRLRRCRAALEPLLAAGRDFARAPHGAPEVVADRAAHFLADMEDLVYAFEVVARLDVVRAKRSEFALMSAMLFILLAEGLFVFRPALAQLAHAVRAERDARDAIAAREAREAAILRAVPDLLVRVRADGRLEPWSQDGDPASLGPEAAIVRTEPHAQALREAAARVRETGAVAEVELDEADVDGRRDYVARLARTDADDVIAVISDVTAERALERAILDAGEQERVRLGQDLHDGLCQLLAGIRLLAHNAGTAPSPEAVKEIAGLLDDAVQQCRGMASSSFPIELESQGLGPAIEALASKVEVLARVSCSAQVDIPEGRIDDAAALQIYRIIQEAAFNASKHAQATEIRISAVSDERGLRVCVEDDGRGFPAAQERGSGMGLRTIRYRSRAIGASLRVTSRPRSGTVVECLLPWEKNGSAPGGENEWMPT